MNSPEVTINNLDYFKNEMIKETLVPKSYFLSNNNMDNYEQKIEEHFNNLISKIQLDSRNKLAEFIGIYQKKYWADMSILSRCGSIKKLKKFSKTKHLCNDLGYAVKCLKDLSKARKKRDFARIQVCKQHLEMIYSRIDDNFDIAFN